MIATVSGGEAALLDTFPLVHTSQLGLFVFYGPEALALMGMRRLSAQHVGVHSGKLRDGRISATEFLTIATLAI